jgi:hypothetical protein
MVAASGAMNPSSPAAPTMSGALFAAPLGLDWLAARGVLLTPAG